MFFAQVYLQLPAELYMTLRAVGRGACRALPSFTMSLGICLARIRRVRQMVDSWEVWQDEFEVQRELASLLVALGVQCELLPSDSREVENVKIHWSVFDEVAVWSPWASTRREAISLTWNTSGTNGVLRALWRSRHAEARKRADWYINWGFPHGESQGLEAYVEDSDAMEAHGDFFPLAVLYADLAILWRDVDWFEDDGGAGFHVGKEFYYEGISRQSLVLDVAQFLKQLHCVPELCLV